MHLLRFPDQARHFHLRHATKRDHLPGGILTKPKPRLYIGVRWEVSASGKSAFERSRATMTAPRSLIFMRISAAEASSLNSCRMEWYVFHMHMGIRFEEK